MKSKFLIVSVLAVLLFGWSSCHKHGESEIEIDIISPAANSVVSNPSSVSINISFKATKGELHEIEVKLYPKNNPGDRIIDFERHVHQKSFTFNETRDLSSYPAGTAFILKAEAEKDHDGDRKVEKSIEFRIP